MARLAPGGARHRLRLRDGATDAALPRPARGRALPGDARAARGRRRCRAPAGASPACAATQAMPPATSCASAAGGGGAGAPRAGGGARTAARRRGRRERASRRPHARAGAPPGRADGASCSRWRTRPRRCRCWCCRPRGCCCSIRCRRCNAASRAPSARRHRTSAWPRCARRSRTPQARLPSMPSSPRIARRSPKPRRGAAGDALGARGRLGRWRRARPLEALRAHARRRTLRGAAAAPRAARPLQRPDALATEGWALACGGRAGLPRMPPSRLPAAANAAQRPASLDRPKRAAATALPPAEPMAGRARQRNLFTHLMSDEPRHGNQDRHRSAAATRPALAGDPVGPGDQ